MSTPSQAHILELVDIMVAKTVLKDWVPVQTVREQLQAAWPTFHDGQRLRLQVLWDVFAGHAAFDAKVAQCPMCWIKTLEPRLGVVVDMPAPLASLKTNEVATQAAKFFVKREDLDRVLGPDSSGRGRVPTPPGIALPRSPTPVPGRLTPVPGALAAVEPGAAASVGADAEPGALPLEPGAPPVDPGAPPLDPLAPEPPQARSSRFAPPKAQASLLDEHRTKILGLSGVVVVAALAMLAVQLRSGCSRPPVGIDAQVLAGLPVKKAVRRGNEAQATLIDPGWLALPVAEREAKLSQALDALRREGMDTLVLVDDKGAMKASVQTVGGKARIRFY
jgi:hypothetical protein